MQPYCVLSLAICDIGERCEAEQRTWCAPSLSSSGSGKGLGTIVAPSGRRAPVEKIPIFPQVTGGDHALFPSGDREKRERAFVYLAVYGCVRKPKLASSIITTKINDNAKHDSFFWRQNFLHAYLINQVIALQICQVGPLLFQPDETELKEQANASPAAPPAEKLKPLAPLLRSHAPRSAAASGLASTICSTTIRSQTRSSPTCRA